MTSYPITIAEAVPHYIKSTIAIKDNDGNWHRQWKNVNELVVPYIVMRGEQTRQRAHPTERLSLYFSPQVLEYLAELGGK